MSMTGAANAWERASGGSDDLVRFYLSDIGQYPLLTKDDEIRLAKEIEAGTVARSEMDVIADGSSNERRRKELRMLVDKGTRAHRVFVNSNLRLVVSIAKKYQASGLPLLDLIQEGNIGLIQAVEKFDCRRVSSSPPMPHGGFGRPSNVVSPTRVALSAYRCIRGSRCPDCCKPG